MHHTRRKSNLIFREVPRNLESEEQGNIEQGIDETDCEKIKQQPFH